MDRLSVERKGLAPYEILMDEDVCPAFAEELGKLSSDETVLLITDGASAFAAQAHESALVSAGFDVSLITIPDDAAGQSVACAQEIWRAMAQGGLSHDALVVAVGGEPVCQMAAFVGATYDLGCKVVFVPTSLSAALYVAAGGVSSLCVDLAHGSDDSGTAPVNSLVGLPFSPALVSISWSLLDQVPQEAWGPSLAALAQIAVLDSEDFFFWLSAHASGLLDRDRDALCEALKRVVAHCCAGEHVESFDAAQTQILRPFLITTLGREYGRTLGRALERLPQYALLPGQGLAQGMRFSSRLAAGLGKAELDFVRLQDELLDSLSCPDLAFETTSSELIELMKHDPKASCGRIRFVVPCGCGTWELCELGADLIAQYLDSWLKSCVL